MDYFNACRELYSSPLPWYHLLLVYILGFSCGWFFKYGVDWLRYRSEERDKKYKRQQQAAEQAAKEAKEKAKEKAIQAIQEGYEISPDGQTLVSKDASDSRHYCKKCGKNGELSMLRPCDNGSLLCPSCGPVTSPDVIRPRGR